MCLEKAALFVLSTFGLTDNVMKFDQLSHFLLAYLTFSLLRFTVKLKLRVSFDVLFSVRAYLAVL